MSTQQDLDPHHFLLERYAHRRPPRLLRAYNVLKPIVPRKLQLLGRRLYARRQVTTKFPSWPKEPLLLEHRYDQLQRRLRESSASRLPILANWPKGRRSCFILSHDVEGPAGIENIPRVLAVERRHGFVSAWNFVAESYQIPEGLFDRIRQAGGEIGLHGIKHDDSLFRDRAHFEAALPKVHRYLDEWGAVGFRSPSTYRNADWMPELGCLYDGSFPDTDPFEPQPGGCCSILPFMIGELVELPITLPQDHTIFEILRDRSIERWLDKARWIIEHHGLVHLLTHPDYLIDERRLAAYDEFLAYMRQQGPWHALPRDVATWWRSRSKLRVEWDGELRARIEGGEVAGAVLAYAKEEEGRIVLEGDDGSANEGSLSQTPAR